MSLSMEICLRHLRDISCRLGTQTENNEVEEIEDDDQDLVAPNTRDVENSLEILKNFFLFSKKKVDQMQDLINKFETLLTRDKVE